MTTKDTTKETTVRSRDHYPRGNLLKKRGRWGWTRLVALAGVALQIGIGIVASLLTIHAALFL